MSKTEDQMGLPALSADRSLALESAPVGDMLSAILAKGMTTDNVAVAERLMGLYERMKDRDAERQFAAAFVNLQSDTPAILATESVPNNDGTVRYKYAPYEGIMEKVRPILQKHGFTVTFSSDVKDSRIVQTCTLQHISGHKRSNQFLARIGRGPPGSSDAQADGAAATYAKRQALCDALNIVVEHDDDARAEGTFISEEQVMYLKEQIRETNSNQDAFLKMAGVNNYEDIGTEKYDILVRALEMKKRR